MPSAPLGLEDTLGRCREPCQLFCRAPRASHQLTAKVGAPPGKYTLGAGPTESALERTDPCLRRLGRKVDIAALTVWTKLKHGVGSRSVNSRVMLGFDSAAVP